MVLGECLEGYISPSTVALIPLVPSVLNSLLSPSTAVFMKHEYSSNYTHFFKKCLITAGYFH